MVFSSTTLPRSADQVLDNDRRRPATLSQPEIEEAVVARRSPVHAPEDVQAQPDASAHIVVIAANALVRTCLIHCLAGSETGLAVDGYDTIEEWESEGRRAAIVLFCVVGAEEAAALERNVRHALVVAPGARVVVISDPKSTSEVHRAIEQGASGFIAMDSSVDIAIAAIRLVRSGGMFVPSHSIVPPRNGPALTSAGASSLRTKVTAKQLEVIGLIRKGLPNKLIAIELEMSEFTVKVHVRNIMKRLKARNRTEVAALTNVFFAQDADGLS